MKQYIGAKILKAEPMTSHEWVLESTGEKAVTDDAPGYKVIYPDNYTSWSPKEVFENAYREITPGEFEIIAEGLNAKEPAPQGCDSGSTAGS